MVSVSFGDLAPKTKIIEETDPMKKPA